jgi:tetratricopeptide (TPR) repeat protein
MKRVKLVAARAEKHWTLIEAAERIGCAPNTLSRWELGTLTPSSYNRARFCAVYGKEATELGLAEEDHIMLVNSPHTMSEIKAFFNTDFTMLLIAQIYTSRDSIQRLQRTLAQAIEEFTMNASHEVALTRREALQRLAMFPAALIAAGNIQRQPIEDTLKQCAAGTTACGYLSKGKHEDLALAFSMLSAYLPVLKTIVRDSSLYRKDAANLVAQCYLLKHVLGLHIESPEIVIAKDYARLAVVYSEESGDFLLHLTALRNLTWAYNHIKQYQQASKTIRKAQSLLERHNQPVPSHIASSIYSASAVIRVKNGESVDSSLQLAKESFFAPSVADPANEHFYVDFGYAQLMRDVGLTHYYRADYTGALASYAEIFDPENLSPRVAMPERIRVEVLHNQVMAALKSPTRDMEQVVKIWTANLQGAIGLKSQQRFDEACTAYEVMSGIWPGEARIRDLRDLIQHW